MQTVNVLDLDLDFFLTDCCPLALPGERPASSCASPWTEEAVVSYLEDHLGLRTDAPIPGMIKETHDGALRFWQERMRAGALIKPFSVVHIDAHADLGIGKPGPGYVLNNVLGIPPAVRDDLDRYYSLKQLDEANYLLFALAFRWIDSLTLVRQPYSRPDLPPFVRRAGETCLPIRLESFVSRLFEASYGAEPSIPLAIHDDPFSYRVQEPFCCAFVAHSPRYAPKESDALLPVIGRYLHLVSGEELCYNN